MAVMGMKRTRDSGKARTENSEIGLVEERFQSGHPLEVDIGEYSNMDLFDSFDSDTSLIGGPTPKRTKPRRSFKPSLAHHTKAQLGSANETGDRRPMKDLGSAKQNMDVSTVQMQHTDAKEVGKESENVNFELGESSGSFNESEIFTSTDQHQFRSRHQRVGTEIYEDTTVEF